MEAATARAHPAGQRLFWRRRRVIVCALLLAIVVALGVAMSRGNARTAAVASDAPATAPLRPHPRVVVALNPGDAAPAQPTDDTAPAATEAEPAPRAASDAQVRAELTAFRRDLQRVEAVRGKPGHVLPDGRAVVPLGAPAVVAAVISAGNEIATRPYKWGGGHGGWADNGYDCSGSVSFALAGAGLLNAPLTSGEFMSWGDQGPGRWITIYANGGHVWMTVAGLRFDTAGETSGTRWQLGRDPSSGPWAVRHPPGL